MRTRKTGGIPMITKEKFVNIISTYQKLQDKEENFNQALDKYDEGNYHCFLPMSEMFDKITYEVLGYAIGLDMENRDEEDLFGWWIYETECGTKEGFQELIENEVKYDISTPEKFYDYVVHYLGTKLGNERKAEDK